MWDVFISHASEDKEAFVRPLAEALRKHKLRVWYDEYSLKVGDSLRRSIDRGLAKSRFGVVVLSPSFFAKEWPQRELDGLTSREGYGRKLLLPVWYKITAEELSEISPLLADRVATDASRGLTEVASDLLKVIRDEGVSPEARSNVRAPEPGPKRLARTAAIAALCVVMVLVILALAARWRKISEPAESAELVESEAAVASGGSTPEQGPSIKLSPVPEEAPRGTDQDKLKVVGRLPHRTEPPGIYVWHFETRDHQRTNLTASLTQEFEQELVKTGCVRVEDRRGYTRLLEHAQRFLKGKGPEGSAELVIFGEVYRDSLSQQVRVGIKVENLPSMSIIYQDSKADRIVKFEDGDARQEMMSMLAQKICIGLGLSGRAATPAS